jgi:hypothetical protein
MYNDSGPIVAQDIYLRINWAIRYELKNRWELHQRMSPRRPIALTWRGVSAPFLVAEKPFAWGYIAPRSEWAEGKEYLCAHLCQGTSPSWVGTTSTAGLPYGVWLYRRWEPAIETDFNCVAEHEQIFGLGEGLLEVLRLGLLPACGVGQYRDDESEASYAASRIFHLGGLR